MPRSIVTEKAKAKAVVDGAANAVFALIPWLAKYVLSDFALDDFHDTHGPRTDLENDLR